MDKVIDNGRVAVIISSRFGAGWYSWHGFEELLYDPVVVDMVINQEDPDKIRLYCEEVYDQEGYFSTDGLEVVWIPIGTRFFIHEYDGQESIRYEKELHWLTA